MKKAKSVVFTNDGAARSEQLFRAMFMRVAWHWCPA